MDSRESFDLANTLELSSGRTAVRGSLPLRDRRAALLRDARGPGGPAATRAHSPRTFSRLRGFSASCAADDERDEVAAAPASPVPAPREVQAAVGGGEAAVARLSVDSDSDDECVVTGANGPSAKPGSGAGGSFEDDDDDGFLFGSADDDDY